LGQERRSFFNTATFLSVTDWRTGLAQPRAVSIGVNVGRLYRWLGSSQESSTSFNRVLLFVLLGIGALLLSLKLWRLATAWRSRDRLRARSTTFFRAPLA
jgi:hypothetical protein